MEEKTPSRTSGEEKVPCAAETMRVIGMAERYVKKNKLQKGQIWCVYDKDSFPADDFNGVVLRAERLNKENPELQYHTAVSYTHLTLPTT